MSEAIARENEVHPDPIEDENDPAATEDEQPVAKRARFEASEEGKNNYKLSEELSSYIKSSCVEYVSDKVLKERILDENPVPENVIRTKKLDSFLKELLEEKGKKFCIKADTNLMNIQDRIRYVFGPLSKVWTMVEEEKEAVFQHAADDPEMQESVESVKDSCTLVEQIVTLLGQAMNSLSYQRRHNILSALSVDKAKAKELLKEEKDSIDKDEHFLFGEDFKDHLKKQVKVKTKARELLGALSNQQTHGRKRPHPVDGYIPPSFNRPFPKGPLPARGTNQYRGRGRSLWSNRGWSNRGRGNFNNRGRGKKIVHSSNFSSFHKQQSVPSSTPKSVPKDSSKCKVTLSGGNSSTIDSSRQVETFSKKLEKVDKRQGHFGSSPRIQNRVFIPTKTMETTQGTQIQSGGKTNHKQGGRGHVTEGVYKRGSFAKGFVFKSHFCGGQKRWGLQTSHQFESIERVHSLCSLQNGKPFFSEGSHATRGFFSKIGFEGGIFCSSLTQRISEIRSVSMGRKNLYFSMPLFRARPSPTVVYETHESTSIIIEKTEHTNDYLFRRHFIASQKHGRGNTGSGHCDIPPSKPGISDKCKEVNSDSLSFSSILGNDDKLCRNETVFASGENRQNHKSMRVTAPTRNCLGPGANKTNRKALLHGLSSDACSSSLQISSGSANSGISQPGFLQHTSETIQGGKGRVNLVEKQSLSEQWEYPSFQSPRNGDQNRCLEEGVGAASNGLSTGGPWSIEESGLHINIQELEAIRLGILTFTLKKKVKSIHIKTDNMTALSYLIKKGGTKCQVLTEISKKIWEYLIRHGITVTAEWLPGILNGEADWESRNIRDSSEWLLNPQIFKRITQLLGKPRVDLFASRTSHQLPIYWAWKPDPGCQGVDAFQTQWNRGLMYAFPPFSLIPRVLQKVQKEKATLILVTPMWNSQPWYPLLLQLCIAKPILLPSQKDLLTDPSGTNHPLIDQGSLRLVAWLVSGLLWKRKEFQKGLHTLSQMPDDQVHYHITNRPGESLLAGVIEGKQIPLDVI